MRQLSQHGSAHMADLKGKGIQYDDDEPIQLTAEEDDHVIKKFLMSLIGKILNPKKQNVEKLIQTMPTQWGMQDLITANDVGNGRFLFNFTSEEDLKSVLSKGPFHYNYCMFVLVRWEPIVYDDYPWIIPFWVQLSGIPLHKKLEAPEGDVTIQIKYDMLFKHCTTCGYLTHEKRLLSFDG
ncbi:hypothetical protein YC2023_116560 [Brassica napus]